MDGKEGLIRLCSLCSAAAAQQQQQQQQQQQSPNNGARIAPQLRSSVGFVFWGGGEMKAELGMGGAVETVGD